MRKFNFKFNKESLAFLGKLLILVIIAMSIVFVAASSFSNVTFSNITGFFESIFLNMKKGSGYPYESSVDGVNKADKIGSYLAIIDDANVIYLNKTAKEVLRYDSTYTSPDIAVSNGRALIYNRGTTAFSVTGQSDIIYKTTDTVGVLNDAIITANIGEGGNLAFGTWSNDGASKFIALNRRLGTEFYYVFGNDRVLYVTLSDNSRYGACAVFGAENAMYYSDVYIFDFNKTEPVKKVRYSGETVIRLDFLRNNKLSVITDLKRRVIKTNSDEEENSVDYSSHTLTSVHFDVASKRSVICYSKYGSTKNIISAFYRNGKESCKIEDIENVRQVSCTSNLIAVLTDNKVLCYSYSGKLKSTVELTFNVDSIELSNSGLYLFSGSNIYRAKTNADTVLE